MRETVTVGHINCQCGGKTLTSLKMRIDIQARNILMLRPISLISTTTSLFSNSNQLTLDFLRLAQSQC